MFQVIVTSACRSWFNGGSRLLPFVPRINPTAKNAGCARIDFAIVKGRLIQIGLLRRFLLFLLLRPAHKVICRDFRLLLLLKAPRVFIVDIRFSLVAAYPIRPYVDLTIQPKRPNNLTLQGSHPERSKASHPVHGYSLFYTIHRLKAILTWESPSRLQLLIRWAQTA